MLYVVVFEQAMYFGLGIIFERKWTVLAFIGEVFPDEGAERLILRLSHVYHLCRRKADRTGHVFLLCRNEVDQTGHREVPVFGGWPETMQRHAMNSFHEPVRTRDSRNYTRSMSATSSGSIDRVCARFQTRR